MKLRAILFGALVIASACKNKNSQEAKSGDVDYLSNDDLKFSYALGHYITAQQIKNYDRMEYDGFDTDAYLAGIHDAIADTGLIAEQDELAFLNQKNQQIQMDAMMKQQQASADSPEDQENKAAGEAFLAENKGKSGVTTTASGLQYEILKNGNGPKPTAEQKVKVHYHGTLIDGTVFDSSVDRGNPAEFGVTQVIRGWVEALQLMPVGSKWKLYIPQELAYGPSDKGTIKPFSALIFEVELLEIVE